MQTLGAAPAVEQSYWHVLTGAEGDPSHPGEALGWSEFRALLARSEVRINWRKWQIETILAGVAELVAGCGLGANGSESVRWLDGPAATGSRVAELTSGAEIECLCLLPDGGPRADAVDARAMVDRQTLQRGIRVRALYPDRLRSDASAADGVRRLTELGVQQRYLPELPMKAVIVDRRTVLIQLDPLGDRQGALELRSPDGVAALHGLFEKLWAVATPWHEPRAAEDGTLTPIEQKVIELLAAGHTDEVVSRRVGVSLRTVRRITADLMARLTARSRFEAGVRAAKLGWL